MDQSVVAGMAFTLTTVQAWHAHKGGSGNDSAR